MSAAQVVSDPSGVVERLLFIVIDGLRVDAATDQHLMPQLAHLAAQGGAGAAYLEALIPSTVAALRTFVTGEVAPPVSFLHDFQARPASTGGLFAGFARHGWQSFVAGPRLWTDLYGAWIAGAMTVETGGAGDARVLQASLAALGQPQYRFVVVHFGQPDDAGHLYGARSVAYARAVAWCDAAIGQLRSRAGARTAVLVTADHGMADNGGHAGPELLVRSTPVVVWGPGMPRGALGVLRQRDIPHVALGATGLKLPVSVPRAEAPIFTQSVGVCAVLMAVAMACGLRLWSALAGSAAGRYEATVLNTAWWIALLLSLLAWRRAALCLTLLVLGSTVVRLSAGTPVGLARVLWWGVLFGILRLGDGLLASQTVPGSAAAWLAQAGGRVVLSGVAVACVAHVVPWGVSCTAVSVWISTEEGVHNPLPHC